MPLDSVNATEYTIGNPNAGDVMKRGDIVEWLDPLTEDEKSEAFRVIELRGDRVLVEDIHSHYNIRPTFAYEVTDLRVRWVAE